MSRQPKAGASLEDTTMSDASGDDMVHHPDNADGGSLVDDVDDTICQECDDHGENNYVPCDVGGAKDGASDAVDDANNESLFNPDFDDDALLTCHSQAHRLRQKDLSTPPPGTPPQRGVWTRVLVSLKNLRKLCLLQANSRETMCSRKTKPRSNLPASARYPLAFHGRSHSLEKVTEFVFVPRCPMKFRRAFSKQLC